MHEFWQRTARRDGSCYVCRRPSCGPLQLMHLSEKVKMGGRTASTVNVPWNVCVGGKWDCHPQQEHSRSLTSQLLGRMYREYGYPQLAEYKDEPPNVPDCHCT